MVPLPSCPEELSPQQSSPPLVNSAHAKKLPVTTWDTPVSGPVPAGFFTTTGVTLPAPVPFPS